MRANSPVEVFVWRGEPGAGTGSLAGYWRPIVAGGRLAGLGSDGTAGVIGWRSCLSAAVGKSIEKSSWGIGA